MGIYGEIVQARGKVLSDTVAALGVTVTALDLLGAAPDFTGGLSVDEYMDEQRGRGQE